MEPDVRVELVKPQRIEDIRMGVEVELACRVHASPPATMSNILWFHNGNARLPSMQPLRNGNLHVASFGMQHVGIFHCRVIHAAGKVDSRPPFVIQMDGNEPPNLDTSVSGAQLLVYALPDRPIKLSCPHPTLPDDLRDSPIITVWGFMKKLGEQQQSITNLPVVHLTDQDSTLTIERFKHVHANFYTCEIGFPGSADRYFYVFQVYMAELYPPKPYNFSPRPRKNQPHAVRLGETLVLRYYPDLTPSTSYTAENISNPPPRIEWFRVMRGRQEPLRIPSLPNGQVAPNTRVFVMHGRHLVVRDAEESDSGSYELVLTSSAGRVSVPFEIMVSCEYHCYSPTMSLALSPSLLAFNLPLVPPEFESQHDPPSQTLDEGESILLSCGIRRRATPGSRIYWEKDGRPLVNYGKCIVELLEKLDRLVLIFDETKSLRGLPETRTLFLYFCLPLPKKDIILEGEGERLRFPRVTVDHQGLYQCFVFTDGYPKKFPGQPQKLEVRGGCYIPLSSINIPLSTGRLQFLHQMEEHFLEINIQGKLACKVRGYGDLSVDWFRKPDPTSNSLEPIQPPNQVERGVLIFHFVQKQDAGDYVCLARSTYRNAQINMTVKVIVGEKPRIFDISSNQTIREGQRLVLNCKASGDPKPQISWIVKKPSLKYPTVYSPLISGPATSEMLENAFDVAAGASNGGPGASAGGSDNGARDGMSANNGELASAATLARLEPRNTKDERVQVLSNGSLVINQPLLIDDAEYICIAGNKHAIETRQGVHVRVLIFVFFSFLASEEYAQYELGDESLSPSMLKTIIIVVNCAIAYLGLIFGLTVYCSLRLLKNRRNRAQSGKTFESGHLISQASAQVTQENNCALLLNEDIMNTGSRATTGSPNDTSGTDIAVGKKLGNVAPQQPVYHGTQNYFMPDGGHQNSFPLSSGYSSNEIGAHQMNNLYPNHGGVVGGSVSIASTTTAESSGNSRLVVAPPPTPLDSRSHLSGLSSSGNSASAYSRSLISGASNSTGPPFPAGNPQVAHQVQGILGRQGVSGGHAQYPQPTPAEMMAYTH
ncbi:unnamed protein product [Schistocephalus solidus]|uniref:Ig-like domain-containing protein n=1 Tax=Schistocephalus solidus TaxID=70667 RepID=A0A183SWF0_SCHSO|nr:unnamed protein product [Schistocephalus solidus]